MATPASIGPNPSLEPGRLPGQEPLSDRTAEASHLTLVPDTGLLETGGELPGAEQEAAGAIPDSSVALGATEMLARARRISYFVTAQLDMVEGLHSTKNDGQAIGYMMNTHEQQLSVHREKLEVQPGGEILSLAAMLIGSGAVSKGSAKALKPAEVRPV
jgi:hypothetical protein